ncbi:MAG: DUF4080 domain-containing protein, partial [Eubacterium sp.]|nr:DUF4080 domain-containing protein [Eubacterium sp.]
GQRGHFDCKQSRIKRYEILWDFAMSQPGMGSEERELFRQALTYDLFSRDYVKNPPEFVCQRSPEDKQKIREFLDGECREAKYLRGYENRVTKQLFHMVYIARFSFDLEAWEKEGRVRKGEEVWLLFDYQKRNPLNHSALVCQIPYL